MRGDQALAWGALAAGVGVVSGYPGSPATGVFDALLARTAPGDLQIGWAPNEKVAMEIAIGASLGGARSLVVLKSVGMNIGLDPLATMTYTGCHKGMVILLGDDPGAWGSQNEQDSRWLARVAEVPVVEPTSVAQAAALMAQAFAWSEACGSPVIVRITRALALDRGPTEEPFTLPPPRGGFLRKRNRWISLPPTAVRKHHMLHARLRQVAAAFEASPYDRFSGTGPLGILAVGHAHAKTREALGAQAERYRLLGLSSVWPLPERALARWLQGVERLLVVEEGGPFVEEGLAALAQRAGMPVEILGRGSRALPGEGELTPGDIAAAVQALDPAFSGAAVDSAAPERAADKPLCPGCPYIPAVEVLLGAMETHGGRRQYVVVGETGCMVRANLPPYELFDVKYSLGAGLGLGMGLAMSDRRHTVVALVGDSSFYHSDLNALPHAVVQDPPLVVVVLDNDGAALTGGQPHPGSRRDERGAAREPADLVALLRGAGAKPVVCRSEEPEALRAAFDAALDDDAAGLRVIVVRGECPPS
ncbi:MAG: indolepyruvate ferredoxin oxidoreductase subunit alpha [Chloroflexi bacterium]|nr:indolepyruvate ferredoxin oxidoreductase subunit alpha [Chloroflexota bacterium]